MSIAYFIECIGDTGISDRLTDQSIAVLNEYVQAIPDLIAIDFFTPLRSHDPFLDDGAGPPLVIQLRVADLATLQNILSSGAFAQFQTRLMRLHEHWLQQALALESYPAPKAWEIPGEVSYLVNYHRPAADETQFLSYYRKHHPPIMARFPRLRNLELGLPVEWRPAPGLVNADRMLFCEVSFDTIEHLNVALASDVRMELRQDFAEFPTFSGPVSHFAMQRRRLYRR